MGHRGIYKVIESGRHAAYYTHWGAASPFSIFNRISMVQELQVEKHRDKSLIDIFAHIGDDGEYHAESEYGEMFELLTVRGRRRYDYSFAHHGELEMRVTLNFDTDTALLEHNPHYSFYKFGKLFHSHKPRTPQLRCRGSVCQKSGHRRYIQDSEHIPPSQRNGRGIPKRPFHVEF